MDIPSDLLFLLLPLELVAIVLVVVLVFAVLVTILPLATLSAPRTFWLALVGRIWKPPADVTDRRFVGPYTACVLVGTVTWSVALWHVRSVLSSVGAAWSVALAAVAVVSVVTGAFVLAWTADLPGGPTSPRAVLEWVAFVAVTFSGYLLVVLLTLVGFEVL